MSTWRATWAIARLDADDWIIQVETVVETVVWGLRDPNSSDERSNILIGNELNTLFKQADVEAQRAQMNEARTEAQNGWGQE